MTYTIETKLKELRLRYLKEPQNREILKRMARALIISEELRKTAQPLKLL